jgi:hypothetical protein
MLQVEDFPGCCGANVLHHFNYVEDGTGKETEWSIALLARNIFISHDDERLLRPLWSFTHSDAQDARRFNPRSLALWLRKEGEYVRGTEWVPHARHTTKMLGFMWHMSPKFRKRLTAELLRKQNQAVIGG